MVTLLTLGLVRLSRLDETKSMHYEIFYSEILRFGLDTNGTGFRGFCLD